MDKARRRANSDVLDAVTNHPHRTETHGVARASLEAGDAMTEPLDLAAIEARLAGVGFSFRHAHLKIEALIAAVRERDAEIARLRDVERRHLGWCDTCQVYHRVGSCDVTGEPPSKEAREGWSRPTPQAAPPGADVMGLAENLFPLSWAELWFSGPLNQLPRLQERVARALQQYGDERAAERDAEIARLTELVATVTVRANIEIARLTEEMKGMFRPVRKERIPFVVEPDDTPPGADSETGALHHQDITQFICG